ncbi:MAG: hemolysin family protein [Oscillospiraceae bacterium]|nr:hemolysin family protein [Oscillospiraceae bacterium]
MWRIIIILLLTFLAAFCSASETAITGVNRIRLKNKAELGSTSAKKALKLIGKYDRVLATILIANNSLNLIIASLATIFAISLAASFGVSEGISVAVVTVIITIFLIVFSDILPKTLAREHADEFVLTICHALDVLMFVLYPISSVMLILQNLFSRIFSNKKAKRVSVTEAELMHIIDEIEDEGVLEEQESFLVRSALEFDETTVEEIMTPRVDMTAVALNDSPEKVRDVFFESGYSRLPVYDKTPDKIVGFISNKEFMKHLLAREGTSESIQTTMPAVQDILRIPALMKLSEALKLMQKKKSHLAVVLDQHGGTDGIVTLEDILEELVGEIWDEDDEETHPVKFTGENTFEVGGELSINDFNRSFEVYSAIKNIEIVSESNTVGGWAFELFEKIPEVGESVQTEQFIITVLSMKGKRIGKLKFEVFENI